MSVRVEMLIRGIIIFLALTVSLVFAESIKVDDKFSIINANSSVKIYKDANGTLRLNDIMNARSLGLKEEKQGSLSAVNSGVYWVCLEVENISNKSLEWVFSMPRANINGTLYFVYGDKWVETTAISDIYVFLNNPTIAYFVSTPPKEKAFLAIRLSFEEGWFLYSQFDIYSKERFLSDVLINTMIKSIGLGAVLILLIYNLFLFFSFRSKAYAWYCVYIFFVFLFILVNSGIGWEFVWKSSELISKNIFMIVYPFLFAAALQFTKEFLKTKDRFPFINRVLNVFLILFLISPLFLLFGFRANAAKVFSISSLAMSLLPVLGFYVWRLGYKEARFYTLAWSVWVIGMIAPMLIMLGVDISYDTVTMSGRLGLIFEAALLSFALADQINILRNERNEAVNKYESQRVMMDISSRQAQMGEMISAISHQWKQPLNIITLMIQNISMTLAESGAKTPQDVNENIASIKQVVGHMSSTIDDFKNFFSPSKRKTLFSPILMTHNILGMVGKQYEYVNMSFEIVGDEKLMVFGRENELKQVVLNLFNNAKDAFCSNNVKSRKIELRVEKEDEHILLTIKDSAGGIPKNILNNIFDQYFTTKGEEGTGIGLYICKKIIEESFCGKISAYNGKNGAIFVIELPAKSS